MNNLTFSVQGIARKYNLSEDEIREALNKGLLAHTYIPKWCISEQAVQVWLLKTGRITLEQFLGDK